MTYLSHFKGIPILVIIKSRYDIIIETVFAKDFLLYTGPDSFVLDIP